MYLFRTRIAGACENHQFKLRRSSSTGFQNILFLYKRIVVCKLIKTTAVKELRSLSFFF